MFFLQIAFMIFILVASIIASVSYSSRRKESKNAFQTLLQSNIIREATEQEKVALKPIVSAQKMHLSYQVYQLSGYYLRHGLENNNNITDHHTIDNIEVFLPYDAEQFLLNYNEAEVILADNFAVVLKLNGAFDIASAKERIIQQQLQKQEEAKRSLNQGQDESKEDTAPDLDLVMENNATGEVKELGERLETNTEASDRYIPFWWFFWSFVAFIITLIIFSNFLRGFSSTGFTCGVIGVLTTLITFWLSRPSRLIKKQQTRLKTVKNVEGQLNLLKIASPNNAHQVTSKYFIGDEMCVQIPFQWQTLPLLPLGKKVNADVRADDNYVVRLGNWKIDDELQKFPVIYKGRYIFLMVLGAISLCWYWLGDGDLTQDLNLTKYIPQKQISYHSAKEMLNNLPNVGDVVHLSGKSRCLLKKYKSNNTRNNAVATSIYSDCRTVYWGETPLQIDKNILPTHDFDEIYSGDFLKTRSYNNYSYTYQRNVSLTFLQNPPKMVQTVEEACSKGLSYCDKLKQTIVDNIKILAQEKQPTTWLELTKYTQTWKYKPVLGAGFDTQVIILDKSAIQSLSLNGVKELWPQIEQSLEQLVDSQQGGVLITSDSILNREAQTLDKTLLFTYSDLTRFVNNLTTLKDSHFSVSGQVTKIQAATDSSDPIISIDVFVFAKEYPTLDRAVYSLWGVFSLLMLGYGGFMFFKLPSTRKRKKALKKYLETREFSN